MPGQRKNTSREIKKNKSEKCRDKVGVIGLGMVGGELMHWFEISGYEHGKDLFCYDIDKSKGYQEDTNEADIIFVCVPTPSGKNGRCDTSIVEKVVDQIKDKRTIVIKSTVPPGTTQRLNHKYLRKKIFFSPEFLTEKNARNDSLSPERQIIGGFGNESAEREAQRILKILPPARHSWPIRDTKPNATEAELTKYMGNVFGYMKVVYANLFKNITQAMMANSMYASPNESHIIGYEYVREMVSADPRIGPAWLNVDASSYRGAGGYCFPKDMNALIAFYEDEIEKLKLNHKLNGPVKEKLLDIQIEGLRVLKAIRKYNRALLKTQGLTEKTVSEHIKIKQR